MEIYLIIQRMHWYIEKVEFGVMGMVIGELDELEGTPKQVAWALQIRQEVVEKAQQSIKAFIENNKPGRAEVLSLGLPRLLAKRLKASWWIDRRYHKLAHWEAEIERLVPEAQAIYDQHKEVWIF